MGALNEVLETAVAERALPFAVAMTANAGGTTFSGAAGTAAPGRAAGEDTAFRIFSMTKAVGSVAALILIDRGRLDPDTPVGDVLPAWDDLPVLDGWDGDTPRLRPARTRATLRHLATHTSGMEYDHWSADMNRYARLCGYPGVLSGSKASLTCPLMSDPGTRWGYGPSTDWIGQMVEAVDGRAIDIFCREEIFEPLGMVDTAFEADALTGRLAEVSRRDPDGTIAPIKVAPPSRPEFYGMGHALYSTAPDYLRFLRMVLNRGQLDGNRILTEEAMELLTTDQMRGLEVLPMISDTPGTSADVNLFPGHRTTHSMGFVRNETDIPGKRSAGSLGWAGVCNTHYWIDPARDLAAVLMTQSLPFAEPPFMATYDAFERAVYAGL